jgi:hypothetical protein
LELAFDDEPDDCRSGNFAFDIEAQGAIDAAARSFGPLPAGYTDDILPIVFSFDPSKLR